MTAGKIQRRIVTRLLNALLLGTALWLTGCASQPQAPQQQYIEFRGFTVKDGLYRPKPGWTFTQGKEGTVIAARANDSIIITPCECALETGGSCGQATIDDSSGDIKELWCVDQNCGFCVGGVAEPDDPSSTVRFNVICINDRKVSR